MNHYYNHDGSTTKELLKKLRRSDRLKEIADKLKYTGGEERKELLEEREKLWKETT